MEGILASSDGNKETNMDIKAQTGLLRGENNYLPPQIVVNKRVDPLLT